MDNMFKTMSKFFEDTKNKAFTSADENSWWFVHIFTRTIFPDVKGNMRCALSRVLDGPFGDEIKPFVQYVMTGGTPTELFPTGGSGFTPVMTVIGLQKFVTRLPKNKLSAQIRDMADQALALYIAGDKPFIEGARANAASSAPIPQLYREAIASERAAAGVSIAAEPQVALRLPNGVCIVDKDQAQMYLETNKIEAEKKESDENKAQRAHDIRKLELEVELAKLKIQAPAPTADTNRQPPPAAGPSRAAAASAAPTPARSTAPPAAKRRKNARFPPSTGAGIQQPIKLFLVAVARNSDE